MQLNSTPISPSKQDKLQSWLKDFQLEVLIEILESQIFQHEVEASNNIVESHAETIPRPGYEAEAKKHAEQVVFLRRMIEEILTLRDAKEIVQFSTATPTKRK